MKKKEEEIVIRSGDVVLFYQNNYPVDFLHVVDIQPDIKKKDFWSVSFLRMGFPSFSWSWLLDSDHLKQNEFTMNGVPCRLQLFSRAVKKEVNKASIDETHEAKDEDSLF